MTRNAPDPASPVARLQKAAKRAKDEGDLTQAEKFAQAARDLDNGDDVMTAVLGKLAKSTTGVAFGRIPKTKRPKMTDAEQSAEFERVAREHGAEGDEKAFGDAMRRIVKPR